MNRLLATGNESAGASVLPRAIAGALVAAGLAIGLANCKTSESEASSGPPVSGNSTLSAVSAAGDDGGPLGDGPLGIASCDEYIGKIQSCFAKDPATKAAREAGFNRMKDGWRRVIGKNRNAVQYSCDFSLRNMRMQFPACNF